MAVPALVLGALLGVAACDASGSARATASSTRPPSPTTPSPTTPSPTTASTATPSTTTATSTPPANTPEPSGLPTPAELAAARADVSRLSVRRLAGQLVVARYSGTAPTGAGALVRRLHLGGVAVFSDNLPTSPGAVIPALREITDGVDAALAEEKRAWPPFLAVDQEGGPVARIGSPATQFPAAMALGAARSRALARQVAKASGDELRALGFTVVMAPDADVTIGPGDPTVGVRSPGSDPQVVADVASGLVKGYLDAGLVATPKHFPGHGSVTTDSHVAVAVQRATVAALMARDLLPFRRLVSEGAPAIMVGHLLVPALDRTNPATVSPAVTTGLLRATMGYRGLVVTDAMEMGAITGRYGVGRAAVLAIAAGADVVLMPADPAAAISAITEAEQSGQLTRARLADSAARMVATLRHNARRPPATSVVGSHASTAADLAGASITQISGRCGGRLVGSGVTVGGGAAEDRARLTASARRAGLRTGSGTSITLLGGGAYHAGAGSSSGGSTGSGDVVVSLDVPYGLAASRARVARVAAYGRTPATFDALVAVLLGRAPARGRLPVAVGGYPLGAGCGA